MAKIYDFQFNDISGKLFDTSLLKGKKVLVVNTASECGLTPQYEQLQELYEVHGGERFTIIGFPANDFGAQEPGSNEQIAGFCSRNYGVTFPMMEKIPVKGENMHPLYKWLTQETGTEVSWNFQKFLVNENGEVESSVAPTVLPIDETIINWIEK